MKPVWKHCMVETEKWYKELERKQKLPVKYDDNVNSNNGEMTYIQCLAWVRWKIPYVDIMHTHKIYEIGSVICSSSLRDTLRLYQIQAAAK